jgi:hypothetical protein
MFRESALLRGLLVGGVCLPLALFLGYQLATPEDRSSLFFVGVAFCALLLPFLLRWHHSALLLCWNLPIVIFFLPGQPSLGIVMAAVSLGVSITGRALNKQSPFLKCPPVTFSLLFLAALTLFTAKMTGGIHGNAFGSTTNGASRYLGVFGAIIGYFGLVSQPVPPKYAKLLAYLFILSGTVAVLHTLFSLVGLESLNQLFPADLNNGAIYNENFTDPYNALQRFTGLAVAGGSVCTFLLFRFGLRGTFQGGHSWRWLAFVGAFALSLYGGYRSSVVTTFLLILSLFYFEKLFRTRLFFGFIVAGLLAAAVILPFSDQMPRQVQRAISFLPVKVEADVQASALGTSDWRLNVWQLALTEVPQYFFIGKGYNYDSMDMYLTQLGISNGMYSATEWAMVSNDFHQGILTLIIPFGIFGVLAFAVFCWGSLRALYANYRYGDPDLLRINTFLLASFIVGLIFYVFIYGTFFIDIWGFAGSIGLSLTLNGGVRRAGQAGMGVVAEPKAENKEPRLQAV